MLIYYRIQTTFLPFLLLSKASIDTPLVDEIGRRTGEGLRVRFGWVKAHAGISGNERADLMAKAGCRESLLPQITEGGVRAMWKRVRQSKRARMGLGLGRVVRWDRRAVLRYTHLRVGTGDLG